MNRKLQYLSSMFTQIHNNVYLAIGLYGIIAISFIALSARSLFNAEIAQHYAPLLPPAWWKDGDINHLLGTDQSGQDIFDYLLLSYRTTISMTMKTIGYVVIIGSIISYIVFFVKPLKNIFTLLLRVIIVVPALLNAVIISLLFDDSMSNILLVIGLAYLPRFVHNINQAIAQEWQKTYIIAYKLDGLSSLKILNNYVIPNILRTYMTEVFVLFGYIMLTLTILTFLGFANIDNHPDLGMMIYYSLSIADINYWAFLAPGLAIMITIVLVNLVNIGIHSREGK